MPAPHRFALLLPAVFLAATSSAFAQTTTISLFGSGIARRTRAEVRAWEGSVGVAAARNVRGEWAVELSVEHRVDRIAQRAGGRLCGPFHNTCFDTHVLRLTSTPVVFLARYVHPWRGRLAPFASVGLRYVPAPSVHDETPVNLVPATFFGLRGTSRTSAELGAGLTWKAGERWSLFAEERMLHRGASEWDPRRRWNAGVRVRL